MDGLINYGPETEKSCEVRNATVTESLKMRKLRLEEQLADINAALGALEANPGVEKVLNLISKTGRY